MKINNIALFIAATYLLALNMYAVQEVKILNNTKDTISFTWSHEKHSEAKHVEIKPGAKAKVSSAKGTDIYQLTINGMKSAWLKHGMAGKGNSLLYAIIIIEPSTIAGKKYHYTVYHLNKAKLLGAGLLDAFELFLDASSQSHPGSAISLSTPQMVEGKSLNPKHYLEKVKHGAEGDL